MKISHELPLSLLHYSYEFNDYDYCLPIFLDRYEQYRLYFQKARLDKRFIIMDNSLFEGYTHTTEDLLSKIEWLQPDVFIVPDEWNDSNATLRNAKHWMMNFKSNLPDNTNLMAVCQGKDMGELITTYQTLVDIGYTHIAFNHSSIAYTEQNNGYTKLKAQMYGRMEFIRRLVETGTVRTALYHHLLGASDWKEFQAYTEFDWIKSVDTSAPIINGALGIKLNHEEPYIKPKEKLEDIMDMDLSDKLDIIKYNIDLFRKSIS